MKTAARMNAIATTGPETSDMALIVASRGFIPRSMLCWTASTTTMASSTTMPMASTRPNMLVMLIEKPSSGNRANVPMIETGTVASGIKRGAPVLQEDEDHQDDQTQSLEEGGHDVADGGADKPGGVVRNGILDARGKIGLRIFEECANPVAGFDRIGAGRQEHPYDGSRFFIEPAEVSVILRAQFHAPQIPHAQERPVRLRPDHDLVELLGLEQPAAGVYRVLEVRSGGDRRLADRAGGILTVLGLDGAVDIGGGQAQLRHPVRIDPDTHSVILASDQTRLSHAGDAADLVHQIDDGVVIEEDGIIPAVGGDQQGWPSGKPMIAS